MVSTQMGLSEENLGYPPPIFLALAVLVLCSSCSKESKFHREKQQVTMPDSFLIAQAKYGDIPVPVGFSHASSECLQKTRDDENSSCFSNAEVFCYCGDLDGNQVAKFYRCQMECYGWDIVDFSAKQDWVFFCLKVNRSCAVVIRMQSSGRKEIQKTTISLFVHNDIASDIDEQRDINSKVIDSFA